MRRKNNAYLSREDGEEGFSSSSDGWVRCRRRSGAVAIIFDLLGTNDSNARAAHRLAARFGGAVQLAVSGVVGIGDPTTRSNRSQ